MAYYALKSAKPIIFRRK